MDYEVESDRVWLPLFPSLSANKRAPLPHGHIVIAAGSRDVWPACARRVCHIFWAVRRNQNAGEKEMQDPVAIRSIQHGCGAAMDGARMNLGSHLCQGHHPSRAEQVSRRGQRTATALEICFLVAYICSSENIGSKRQENSISMLPSPQTR